MAMVVGGAVLRGRPADVRPWLALATATGIGLLAIEVKHGREWPWQGRGVLAMAHVGALALLPLPRYCAVGALLALLLGAVGSHMPRRWRKWSFRLGKVVDDD